MILRMATFRTKLHIAFCKQQLIMNEIGYPEKLERVIEVNTLVLNGICTLTTIRDGANPKGESLVVKDACVRVCNYPEVIKTLKRFSGTGGRGEETAMSEVWRGLVLVPGVANLGRHALGILQSVSPLIVCLPSGQWYPRLRHDLFCWNSM